MITLTNQGDYFVSQLECGNVVIVMIMIGFQDTYLIQMMSMMKIIHWTYPGQFYQSKYNADVRSE